MNRHSMMFAALLFASPVLAASKPSKLFYVYSDKGSKDTHFAPSGWMGDYGDLKINDADMETPVVGRHATKWTYTRKGSQGANWAGVFYQEPPNNWGEKPGGFDLSEFTRLTFWARGEKGNERIAEFKVGGITGTYSDTDSASIGPIDLTKEWKKYTIDLKDKNLSHIIGGFCWAASGDDNPDGFVIFLDEIRYEK